MARKARVEFDGAVYHVLDRGDRREDIFRDETDRAPFSGRAESIGRDHRSRLQRRSEIEALGKIHERGRDRARQFVRTVAAELRVDGFQPPDQIDHLAPR